MTSAAGGIFWKARIFEEFSLAMEPEIIFAPAGHATAPLGFELNPTFGMAGSPHVQAAMNVDVTPVIAMRGSQNEFDFAFDLAIGMTGDCTNQETGFGLTFTPTISMVGVEKYSRPLGLAFTPAITVDATAPPYCTTRGAGASSYGSTFTQSHNIVGNAAVVFVSLYGTNPDLSGVTIGGVGMNQLQVVTYYAANGWYGVLYVFGLLNPPTGTQNVSVNTAGTVWVSTNSLAFQSIASFGVVKVDSGYGTSLSQTVTSAADKTIAQAFTCLNNSVTGYNRTGRWTRTVGANNVPMVMGGAKGAASVGFSGSVGGDDYWGALAVRINPA